MRQAPFSGIALSAALAAVIAAGLFFTHFIFPSARLPAPENKTPDSLALAAVCDWASVGMLAWAVESACST